MGLHLYAMLILFLTLPAADGSTPKIWQEFWHGTGQADNNNLTLMYDDEYVAVYFDFKLNTFMTWPFEFVSRAWKYVQLTYGHFGQNPRLYIVLHGRSILTNEPQCSQYVFVNSNVGLPNLIDCAQTRNGSGGWALNTTANLQKLLFSLGNMVQKGAHDMLNDADMSVCGDEIKAIVIYDLYLHLKKTLQLARLMEWDEPNLLKALELEFPFPGRNCFKDWFLPIYRNHGGASTIGRFFRVTHLHGKYRSQGKYGGYFNLNVGEFIHFWSEAANIDLQPLAAKAFNWTSQLNEELIQARNLTWHNYTVNNFTLTYADEHVDFYSEPKSTYPFSTYPTISKSWEYYQNTYGPFKEHLTLSVILRKQTWNPLGFNDSCITSNITYCGASTGFFNVVDCGASLFRDENGLLDSVVTQMGKMALSLSQGNDGDIGTGTGTGTGSWPAFSVSQWSITSIIVYDLYLHLGLQRQGGNANRWLGRHLHGFEDPLLRYESRWFNDFYLKIYNTYGKTEVLKTFISILIKNVPQKTADGSNSDVTQRKQLNFGEFIHFWSSAANEDLRNLARNSIGWNDTFQIQFVNARISTQGQEHKYPCKKDCDELPQSDSGKTNVRLGIGIGAAVIGLIVVFAAFGYKIHLDKKVIRDLSQQIRDLTTEEVEEFINGNGNIYSREAHAPIQSLPFQNEYEIPKERLIIEESNHLGSGEFGVVKRGVLKGDEELGIHDTVVAVKTVKPNIEVAYFKAFLVEIKIMAFLGQHENIASLLGTVTQNIVNRKVFVALEFCAKGDLLRHLRENRDHFVNLWKKEIRVDSKVTYQNKNEPSSVNNVTRRRSNGDGESTSNYSNFSKISTMDLITWSQQISNGMAYLSSKEVIHGDLAARNVLLTENNVAKISDFGLSRQLVNYSHYKKSVSTTPLPWKWLAIESLTDMTFSIHSDIWAFGVTLWEIFNLGKVPYPGRNWDHEFVDELAAGLRLESPGFGNKEIYNLMLHCMAKKPTQRITFPQIHSRLETIGACLSCAEANAFRDFCYVSLEE